MNLDCLLIFGMYFDGGMFGEDTDQGRKEEGV